MKQWIAKHILRPLVERDYRLRATGKRPDRWHWADFTLVEWGYWDAIPDELQTTDRSNAV